MCWEEEIASLVRSLGLVQSRGSPCNFYNKGKQSGVSVLSDDFTVLGSITERGIFGRRKSNATTQEIRHLNRLISWTREGVTWEADPRHVDLVTQGLGVTAVRTCLMFVVFLRRLMSTLQWLRPETNVSFQPTCCCSVSLLLWSVARKCCSSHVSFMSLARCMQSGARNVPRNLTLHRLSAYSRDLLTPHLWIAVCIRSASVKQKSVSPQHPRVARTTLRGSWVHTSRTCK